MINNFEFILYQWHQFKIRYQDTIYFEYIVMTLFILSFETYVVAPVHFYLQIESSNTSHRITDTPYDGKTMRRCTLNEVWTSLK